MVLSATCMHASKCLLEEDPPDAAPENQVLGHEACVMHIAIASFMHASCFISISWQDVPTLPVSNRPISPVVTKQPGHHVT